MKSTRLLATLLCAVPLATPATPSPASTPTSASANADTILINGHILTVDAADHTVEALAIHDGKILAVGTNSAIRSLASPGARVIDLHGLTATPGLIDAHAHIAQGGTAALYSLDLSDASTIAEVRRRVTARIATLKPGQWLLGQGWDEGKFAERRYLLAADLDDITPANPVWLEQTTGHYGTANSAALKLAHIDAATPDPPAGTIDRTAGSIDQATGTLSRAAGKPSGVLKESAADKVRAVIPAWTLEQEKSGILASLDLMHREGMTGVKDPDIVPLDWEAYEALARDSKLTAHVCVLWHTDPTLEAARATIARLAKLPKPPDTAAANLVSCGAKLYMDGSGGARTAWMYDDWHKNSRDVDTGNHGYPLTDPAIYREQIRLLHNAGIHVGTHTIGDRAIDWVVDTYALVLEEHPISGLRHAIIHANTPSDHAIDVMATLQRKYDAGYPETQPPFAWWIGDNYAGNLGLARSQRLNPYHTYLEHGIHWAGGSDYSVTPLPARYGLWASLVRMPVRGTYGAQPFGTAQSVDILTALKSYTIWAAHQLFLERESGSLEPGKSADIAVWDRDLTAVPAADVKDMKCQLTLFRGQVVYRAEGSIVAIQ